MVKNRYTPNGSIFYKEANGKKEWVVQVAYHYGGGGVAFKNIVHTNWINSKAPLGFAETNEDPEMYGWTLASHTDLILFADKSTIDYIERIQGAIRLGYRGWQSTPEAVIAELEWRLSQ